MWRRRRIARRKGPSAATITHAFSRQADGLTCDGRGTDHTKNACNNWGAATSSTRRPANRLQRILRGRAERKTAAIPLLVQTPRGVLEAFLEQHMALSVPQAKRTCLYITYDSGESEETAEAFPTISSTTFACFACLACLLACLLATRLTRARAWVRFGRFLPCAWPDH